MPEQATKQYGNKEARNEMVRELTEQERIDRVALMRKVMAEEMEKFAMPSAIEALENWLAN